MERNTIEVVILLSLMMAMGLIGLWERVSWRNQRRKKTYPPLYWGEIIGIITVMILGPIGLSLNYGYPTLLSIIGGLGLFLLYLTVIGTLKRIQHHHRKWKAKEHYVDKRQ